MKKLLFMMFGIISLNVLAQTNPNVIYGTECSINTYDSHEEAGNIGKFGLDSHAAFVALIDKIKANNFSYKNEIGKLYYWKDFEFLVELNMAVGRGSDHHFFLTITNTGKFGSYSKAFHVETKNTGNTEADTKSLIKQMPKCEKIK
jgi:hypothetical protein